MVVSIAMKYYALSGHVQRSCRLLLSLPHLPIGLQMRQDPGATRKCQNSVSSCTGLVSFKVAKTIEVEGLGVPAVSSMLYLPPLGRVYERSGDLLLSFARMLEDILYAVTECWSVLHFCARNLLVPEAPKVLTVYSFVLISSSSLPCHHCSSGTSESLSVYVSPT